MEQHTSGSLQFTEWMRGYACRGQTDPQRGYDEGRESDWTLMFELTVRIDDVDRFIGDRDHAADASGYVEGDAIGGRREVQRGRVNLLVSGEGDSGRKLMVYRLFLTDDAGNPVTFVGTKDLFDNLGPDAWPDTTTLRVLLLGGHLEDQSQDPSARVLGAGILKIRIPDFLKQLGTFRATASTRRERVSAIAAFGRFFLGSLWDVYGPVSLTPSRHSYEREIPLYTTEGVADAEVRSYPFSTGDKMGLSLLRFTRAPSRDAVMIIHGLTTSSDMFIMPEHRNLVTCLLDAGFTDVWTLDFRMSNRFPYNMFRHRDTMDDIALQDMPAALATVRASTGEGTRVHVICHCLGAVSFMMALFGRTVTDVTSVIANSVALTPRVPRWSRLKIAVAPFMIEYALARPYLSPRWSQEPGLTVGKVLTRVNSCFHRECDVPECHMLSMMWGTGWPALYEHANLADVTHRRGGDLYGPTSMHYYRHVGRMLRSGSTAVKYNPDEPRHTSLPDNYFEHAADIRTPVLLVTGANNRVFTDSNIECYRRLERIAPGRHHLHVFPGYGHQDVFMGKDIHRDIAPTIIEFLRSHRDRAR